MSPARVQGAVFCVVAMLATGFSLTISTLDERTGLAVLGVLVVLLSVPHGALATVFARQAYRVRSVGAWAVITVVYLMLAAAVVLVWLSSPGVFLLGFLLVSAVHFSGDPARGTPPLTRGLYGGAMIVLPTLLHGAEVRRLFTMLADDATAAATVSHMSLLALPWLASLSVTAILRFRRDRLTALEVASVGLSATLAPPLLAFGVFFSGMHSALHILRTFDYAGHGSPRLVAGSAMGPLLGITALSAVAWYLFRDVPVDARAIKIVFVGLAALTVPHMALLEPIRLSGWGRGAAASFFPCSRRTGRKLRATGYSPGF